MELVQYFVVFILLTGISTLLWATVGIVRLIANSTPHSYSHPPGRSIRRPDVAVLIAARNESSVIKDTIESTARLISRDQIYVISDASSDHTGAIARRTGVSTMILRKNRGKAGALVEGIKKFQLTKRYKVVLFLDADTRLDKSYFRSSLPMFRQEGVVAVAGSALTLNDKDTPFFKGSYLLAYRQRIYAIFQLLVKYGQASKYTNAVTIVPGFASMYRSEVLEKIHIAAPGFVIEDYNMTFEIHAKKLGRIAFQPTKSIAYTQDPDNMSDYMHQTRRWTLGFWQAVTRHKFRPTLFGWTVGLAAIESIISSMLFIIGTILIGTLIVNEVFSIGIAIPSYFPNPYVLLALLFAQDYLLTIIAAIALRKPSYLLLGIGFVYMRFIEFVVNLSVIRHFVLRERSTGIWKSPSRRLKRIQVQKV